MPGSHLVHFRSTSGPHPFHFLSTFSPPYALYISYARNYESTSTGHMYAIYVVIQETNFKYSQFLFLIHTLDMQQELDSLRIPKIQWFVVESLHQMTTIYSLIPMIVTSLTQKIMNLFSTPNYPNGGFILECIILVMDWEFSILVPVPEPSKVISTHPYIACLVSLMW